MKNEQAQSLPVLVIDDEEPWLHAISLMLERVGNLEDIILCRDSRKAMEIMAARRVGVVLLDLVMPYVSGEELLQRISEEYPETPVIVLTALNQVETGIKCMKSGAYDYFVKTADEGELITGVLRALSLVELRGENQKLKAHLLSEEVRNPDAFSKIVTQSFKLRAIFRYIEAIAASTHPVLIQGESGVGKELVAEAVHLTSRPHCPFVALNVAGLDDNVLSDTLFGHLPGAFTGAAQARPGMIRQAGRGTLFLDEIGDLSMSAQVKLLRLLQENEYLPLGSDHCRRSEARIIVATNQDLPEAMSEGRFRKDLYYRLQSHCITVPPLRERKEDIPLLLNTFLREASASMKKRMPAVPEELYLLLQTYDFPGNVRELRAMVNDAVSRHDSGKLSTASFKMAMGRVHPHAPHYSVSAFAGDVPVTFHDRIPTISETIDILVREAVKKANGNQTIAAGLLGITQPSLSRRLKKMKPRTTGAE